MEPEKLILEFTWKTKGPKKSKMLSITKWWALLGQISLEVVVVIEVVK